MQIKNNFYEYLTIFWNCVNLLLTSAHLYAGALLAAGELKYDLRLFFLEAVQLPQIRM